MVVTMFVLLAGYIQPPRYSYDELQKRVHGTVDRA
jgi:hypothetical protein